MGTKMDKRNRRVVRKAAQDIQNRTLEKFRDDMKGMKFSERFAFAWMVLFVK